METKPMEISVKKWFYILIITLSITNLAILLDIPFLRQILGFLFLTLLPGLLILKILKLNKIGFSEKFILSWGLSISFLMFFGLLINNSLTSLGYETPLRTIPLLISFNIAFIVLAIVGHLINKNLIKNSEELHPSGLPRFLTKNSFLEKIFKNWLPNFNLTTSEKAFLIVPVLFPALSIFGMHVMNTTDNNIILMLLLFLIPIYVIFVCFFNQKFSNRLYPVVIVLISLSLLLLISLRSNHLIGSDTHVEYYLFLTTLDNLHWRIFTIGDALDACLSISLLPTIYQSILNIPSEFLFKILYSVLYSISPLAVYVLSNKYVKERYAFLASCFFMFQSTFLMIAEWARISIAILFFTLAMMTLFNDKLDPLKKKILFIVFMASCMISHYSTTYIFFFVMVGTFIGLEILSKKFIFKKLISLTLVVLFFAMIFFWYSQVTVTSFNVGIDFIEETILNLNKFFIMESREDVIRGLMTGQGLAYPILSRAYFVLTWCTFILIGIGVLTMIKRHKEMIDISNVKHEKPDFLKTKFEMEYLAMTVACTGLLVIIIALPFISIRYDIYRTYSLARVILSVCFVIGGITLSHFLSKERTCAKKETLFAKQKAFMEKCYRSSFGKTFLSKKRFVLKEQKSLIKKQKEERKGEIWKGKENRKSVEGKNALQVRAYLIILLILIPYSMFTSGLIYQLFGDTSSIILNSEGREYDAYYVYDQESYGAKWLGNYAVEGKKMYADFWGSLRLVSQGKIPHSLINYYWFSTNPARIDGYIYLGYHNVVNGKLVNPYTDTYNMTDYQGIFFEKNEVYDSGCTKILS